MKKVLPSLFISLLMIVGCDNDIEITAPVVAPTAVNDTSSVDDGGSVKISVLKNDNASKNRTLNRTSIIITSEPKEGSATLDNNGTITYTSDGVFTGTETFTYTVKDNKGTTSNIATVTVTISSIVKPIEELPVKKNTAPTAVNDTATTKSAIAVTINVLNNDINNGNGLNKVFVIKIAENGTTTSNTNGTITYTSNVNFTGTDSFTYQVSDSDGSLSNVATVSVTVSSENDEESFK